MYCGRVNAIFLHDVVRIPQIPNRPGGYVPRDEFLEPVAKSQASWLAAMQKTEALRTDPVSMEHLSNDLWTLMLKKDKTAVDALDDLRGFIYTIHRAYELRHRASGGKSN